MTWEYISGFFDADGSITAVHAHKNKNKSIQLSFHNTQLSILEEIQDFIFKEIGVKGSICKKVAKKDNHTDGFDLKYQYRNALKVANSMTLIHPKKKHRVEIYNEIQKNTKRNGKYTESEKEIRLKLVEKFFSPDN